MRTIIYPKGLPMSDLSNSVILPREDFIELQTAAWDQPTKTASQRVATTVQTTFVVGAMAAAFAGASWGWAQAMDWRERRQHERKMEEKQFDIDNPS